MSAQRKLANKWVLLSVLFLVAVMILSTLLNRAACSWYGHETNRDTRYSFLLGCMVQVGNQWVPQQELRVVQ